MLPWFERILPGRAKDDKARAALWRRTLSGPEGDALLADLVQRGGLLIASAPPTAAGSGAVAAELAYREGRRALVLELLALAGRSPDFTRLTKDPTDDVDA